jgi:hypothetical protein
LAAVNELGRYDECGICCWHTPLGMGTMWFCFSSDTTAAACAHAAVGERSLQLQHERHVLLVKLVCLLSL